MNLYSFSVAMFAYGVFLVAILALIKRRDKVAIFFLFFSISVFGWGFIYPFWASPMYSDEMTLALIRFSYCFVIFIPITWIHFVLQLVDRKPPRFLLGVNYLISIIFLFFLPTDYFFSGLHSVMDFERYPSPGIAHTLHMFHFIVLVPIGFFFLYKNFKKSVDYKREQLKYLITGTAAGFIGGGSVYAPAYNIEVSQNILILMPLYPLLTGIALIRYGLFAPEEIADAFQNEKLAAIGVLSASINHEIKNPLYIIQGLAGSFVSNFEENRYRDQSAALNFAKETMNKIETQATRAADIMKRFSIFVKQRTSISESEGIKDSNLLQVLENVLLLVRYELELDKIELKINIPNDLPRLKMNPNALEEVLFNLIMNSCQAIGQDGGEIQINATSKRDKVIIEISDSGPGISKQTINKVFAPFYSTKRQGVGLGLYITKQLVKKNGGEIFVENNKFKGCKFTLKFRF